MIQTDVCPRCVSRISYQSGDESTLVCKRCGWTKDQEQTDMRAITLRQPWASLIAAGYKTIETRLHNRMGFLKGQHIAIHAGKQWDDYAWAALRDVHAHPEAIDMARPHSKKFLPIGAILCTVLVHNTGWLQSVHSSLALIPCWNSKRFGLFLSELEVLPEPVPCRGRQGAWTWRQ